MLYRTELDDATGETHIELISNTFSDAWPMLKRITFRKASIDLKAQSLPLAAALLTRAYCGDVFEFEGVRIGSDYADAIQCLFSSRVNVLNVDGANRSFSTGELDFAVSKAGHERAMLRSPGRAPLVQIDWSGDFVDPEARSSQGFAYGGVHTNAQFFADDFTVSVAIGLLMARDRCATLAVAPPARTSHDLKAVHEALRIVGVALETVPAAAQDTMRAVA
jgi:hypothetical protein